MSSREFAEYMGNPDLEEPEKELDLPADLNLDEEADVNDSKDSDEDDEDDDENPDNTDEDE